MSYPPHAFAVSNRDEARTPSLWLKRSRAAAALVVAVAGIVQCPTVAHAEDVSAPAILQWFEGTYGTMERRTADVFDAGYGSVWTPPPGRADTGDHSVGYDVYDRFDLGVTGRGTLYGTETGLKNVASTLHRAGLDLHIDFVINHNGYSGTGGDVAAFRAAGDYPGFVTTLPNDVDGDFHGAFQGGDHDGRLAGLIDIDHGKNHRFIRSPVTAGDPRNIPGGTYADRPDANNRRFYTDQQGPSFTFDDPATGENNLTVYRFNTANPMAGDAVEENATGYLMRNAQWLVQEIGVDGFRIDAAKHVPISTLNYFDRAVFRANPRTNLDGSEKRVFSYGEVFTDDRAQLQAHTRKDGYNPAVVGGNRDALDFAQFFALRNNLTSNGFVNDWRNVANAGMDVYDDGLHNGSRGVLFASSHDEHGPDMSNVAHAYTLMQPGNSVVYFNGKEHGDGRDFPKDGRGDALGGMHGDAITTLVKIRNTHGRGNYRERWIEKENLAFEREKSALVLLSNRRDGGYDTRRMDVGFDWGTTLVELTGNAADDANIPDLVTVDNDYFAGPSKATVRFRRNDGGDKGYLVYGLANPRSQNGIELSGVSQVIAGENPAQGAGLESYRNGSTRLADLHVVTGDAFNVTLQTQPVTLTGRRLETDQLVQRDIRDRDADGDNALLKIDGGLDVNGNGQVDFVTPGSVNYGFEQFQTMKQTGYSASDGNGRYEQVVDATQLAEGYHFIETRAFRHRSDGGPEVYTPFKETIYVDRFKPESGVDSFHAFSSFAGDNDVWVRSLDNTAEDVRVFLNLPAGLSEAEILAKVAAGEGKTDRIDRDVFKTGFFGVPNGNNALTVVTREITNNTNVQRFTGLTPASVRGAGLGDLNHNGSIGADDLAGTPYGFEYFLYSRNEAFNPAADFNADGLVDNRDLFEIRTLALSAAALDEYGNVLSRRGNINREFGTDGWDIDALFARRGMTGDAWFEDLNVDGAVTVADVDTLVETILGTAYGDATLDTRVDMTDFHILADHFGQTGGWAVANFNGDAIVNDVDFLILTSHFGYGTGGPMSSEDWNTLLVFADSIGVDRALVPEPSAAALLLITGATLSLRRRRRGGGVSTAQRTD